MATNNLNTDIYNISDYVNNIKKQFINLPEDTMFMGIFGYTNEVYSSMLQNALIVQAEYANEAIPIKAKFEKNIITHALSLGISDINAVPASMSVLLGFMEDDIHKLMNNNTFIFDKDSPIYIGDFEFHTEYDIIITKNLLQDKKTYAYAARYLMDKDNPLSSVTNPYLTPPARMTVEGDNFIYIQCTIRQYEQHKIYKKVLTDNTIENKTINFDFDSQLASFEVEVTEGNDVTTLVPIYEGLYQNSLQKYCYYSYIDSSNIRIKFDRDSYEPRINSDVVIDVKTTQGSAGNFSYTDDLTFNLTSEKYNYTNLLTVIKPVTDSQYGTDKKTIDDLKRIIPKESISRGSITNTTDLNNFFNMINSDTSKLYFYKKRDNQIERLYYSYILLKDTNNIIIPTNTIDIDVSESDYMTIVQNSSERYTLTADDVQIGSIVKQMDNGMTYIVKDIDNLDSDDGYSLSTNINKFIINPGSLIEYNSSKGFINNNSTVSVKDEAERFNLANLQVTIGTIIEQLDTREIYRVIDTTKLDSEEGYERYTNADVPIPDLQVDNQIARFNLASKQVQPDSIVLQKDTGATYSVKDIDNLDSDDGYENCFAYSIPFMCVINTDPLYVSYYMNIINMKKFLNFEYINETSKMQFISTNADWKREYLNNRNSYFFNISTMQNIASDAGLVEKDPDGNIIIDDEGNVQVKMKMYMVLYKDDVPYRYIEAKCKNVDETTFIYDFQFEFQTNDVLDNDNNIRIDNLKDLKTGNISYGYLEPNTKSVIYILSDQGDTNPSRDDADSLFPINEISKLTLSNKYLINNGLDFYYNYSHIISSTVTPHKATDGLIYYEIKGVPVVRYTYLDTEDKMKSLIYQLEQRKEYINYSLETLEDAFGIDFKFFNTYGPSNKFYISSGNKINQVQLTLNFEIKCVNETDKYIRDYIIRDIKEYIEDINNITDLHIPNLITTITNNYREQLVYFEFLGMNGYGPGVQHILQDDSEQIGVVPEFLNINTLPDGTPDINIRLV